ncbi:MAG: nucleotide exchange factor GrpE [Bacteroidales bacterium]
MKNRKMDTEKDMEKVEENLVDKEVKSEEQTKQTAEQTQEQPADNKSDNQPSNDAAKIAELNDKYLRLAAEFDNYRRRTAKERLDLIMTASEETIKGLLPVLDDFERAIKVLKDSGAEAAVVEGTELIYKKMFDYLKSKGLAVVESNGKDLDTDFHEAIAQIPAPEETMKNKIIDTVQLGYTLNGKVIRYAKVVMGV